MQTKVWITATFFSVLLAALCPLALAGVQTEMKADVSPNDRQGIWTFETEAVGKLPAGAEVFSGDWAVRPEPDAPSPPNALCQTGEAPFPALMLGGKEYKDISISTRFKPISGRIDQAAGILFRIRDRNNYYIVRANALEDNVNLYKYENGLRFMVKEAYAKVVSGKWQELMVEMTGDRIRAFLDGQLVLEARDGTFETGKIGLWTKADSQTCFDNVKVVSQ